MASVPLKFETSIPNADYARRESLYNEIKQWMDNQTEMTTTPLQIYNGENGNYVVSLRFANMSDYTWFKLNWKGSC